MSTTIAPTILDDNFLVLLRAKVQDDDTQNAVINSFQQLLKESSVQNDILEDIRQLKKTVANINNDFLRIGVNLYSFDMRCGADDSPSKLKPKWDAYHQKFTVIMDKSRKNALKASVCLMMYVNNLLEDVTTDKIPNLLVELRNLKRSLVPNEVEASEAQEDFTKLSQDIRLFHIDIDVALEQAETSVSDDVLENKRHQLHDVKKELEGINTKMHEVGRAFLSCLGDIAASLGAVLFTLSPVALASVTSAIARTIYSGSSYIDAKVSAHYTQQYEALKKDINECNRELRELLDKKHELIQCKEVLEVTKEEISSLSEKVLVITNIWKSIKGDIQKLEESLRLILDNDGTVTSYFSKKLQTSRQMFQTLQGCLVLYADS